MQSLRFQIQMARTGVYARGLLSSKENVPPETPPLTPKRNAISTMRDHWEHKFTEDTNTCITSHRTRDSPTLIQLKHPIHSEAKQGNIVSAVQKKLAIKHHAAKSRLEGVGGLGGGVSLWPTMDDMRLSSEDTRWLVCVCAALIAATFTVFLSCHGGHISQLNSYSKKLREFHSAHSLSNLHEQEMFDHQLLVWHQDFGDLQSSIHKDFDMQWSKSSIFDVLFIVLYLVGILTLLYLLARNMLSKQRLTPRLIKAWLSLLCVVTVWTILSVYLLVCAQGVESATQGVIHTLNEELVLLVHSSLDLTKYHSVLIYWRTRSLPPTSTGVLSIMGLVAVKDVSYYLQYYSLPILTALCTPIVKVVISLRKVYSHS